MRGDRLSRQWWSVQAIEASPNGLTVAEIAKRSPFMDVFEAIRQLMAPKEAPNKKIGFQLKEKRASYFAR